MPLSNAERQLRFRRRQQERRAAALDLWDVPIKLDAVMARYEPLLPGWRGGVRGWDGTGEPGVPKLLYDVLYSADDARTAMRKLLVALVELDGVADAGRLIPVQPDGEPS
jgi:hypothetical protein